MTLRTGKEYIESLRKLNLNVYMFGEKVECPVEHPIIVPSMNAVALTYDLALDPLYEGLMTVKSHLTGEKVNLYNHVFQSTSDLVQKVKRQRMLGQKTACCFQRCVGQDALNAVYSTAYEVDQKYGTHYLDNVKEFLLYVQKEDLVTDGAMTDTKGDRGLSPSKQKDPDLYLRVVERREDGIVVNGCKAHQTGIVNSHEVLCMPTIAMSEEDKDYAVSFSVPTDSPGITIIYGRQSCDTRKLEGTEIDLGNSEFGGHEALVVFDHVFVPNNRIFLDGETEFAGMIVERFAGHHRPSYACKVGVGDVLIGAAALSADYNGVQKASHIKDKLIEMTHLNETIFSSALACSYEGVKTPSGAYLIDLMLANVCKQNVTRFPYEIGRLAQDIAGGIMVSQPSEKDFRSKEIGHYIEKYLKGVDSVPTESRMRVMRLIENLTLGTGAVGYITESMHGAGSPQAQRIMIGRLGNFEHKKGLAKNIAKIKE
ncbi:4-hydroxyphenylacetate 3-hydroxylase family protein [Clostridium aminobutyricum]|uniref:4-hydroxyphenylacetate 3-hydroxylase family protein n=1 Tax=Clostridium aminobutyricum TaxID=33953 RepID=A0A939D7P7_CLOAM|nr:4-hydroxyphenylacetate 3-hydroxylase family protein [Clostridium aminobutyricum]MBN7772969.1 4-hydroxyphenylacetate 3-hydroxylase family protein [Clostridium aminobutyricum]